jgi:hypothetical protein
VCPHFPWTPRDRWLYSSKSRNSSENPGRINKSPLIAKGHAIRWCSPLYLASRTFGYPVLLVFTGDGTGLPCGMGLRVRPRIQSPSLRGRDEKSRSSRDPFHVAGRSAASHLSPESRRRSLGFRRATRFWRNARLRPVVRVACGFARDAPALAADLTSRGVALLLHQPGPIPQYVGAPPRRRKERLACPPNEPNPRARQTNPSGIWEALANWRDSFASDWMRGWLMVHPCRSGTLLRICRRSFGCNATAPLLVSFPDS